ncbi:TVP38/TMEM64 family inner membrane protein YdjZ [Thalassocella blandensis]|nr:TVP38/TMEM64 family inner membrane protein YdjZ [Thalassocella blandensis]
MPVFPFNFNLQTRIVLVLLLAILGLFIAIDIKQYISVGQVNAWYQTHPATTLLTFVLVYLAVASFSLPGTGPLTFAAGAVFGVWQGILLVSILSAVGATGGMLLSRLLLRNWVERQYQRFIEKVNLGLERDGKWYLFSLRLIPPIPYFIVNLVFGVTHMRALTFFWVSQLGMLPLIMLYVNAGANLGQLEELSWSAIFTAKILFGFALLIVVPFALKIAMQAMQRRAG